MRRIYVNGCYFYEGTMQDVADLVLEYLHDGRDPQVLVQADNVRIICQV